MLEANPPRVHPPGFKYVGFVRHLQPGREHGAAFGGSSQLFLGGAPNVAQRFSFRCRFNATQEADLLKKMARPQGAKRQRP